MPVDNNDRFGDDEVREDERWMTAASSTDRFLADLNLAGFEPGIAALMEYRPNGIIDGARQIFAGRAKTCVADGAVIDWDKRRRRNGGR